MKRILTPILLLTFLFPSLAYGVTMDDLVKRGGLHYEKFSDEPFTGKVAGKQSGTMKDGEEHGTWVIYHPNGQLMHKGTHKNGKKHGPYVVYWENGQLEEKGTYKNDKRDGPWVFYKLDGTKRFTKGVVGLFTVDEGSGTYKNGVKVSD